MKRKPVKTKGIPKAPIKPPPPNKKRELGSTADRRSVFVREYLVDFNGTQAAIRAGYSVHTAASIASDLLSKPEIKEVVDQAKAERAKRLEVTADNVVRELAKVAFANSGDYFKWGPSGIQIVDRDSLSKDQQAAVAEAKQTYSANGGSVHIKMHDKVASLEKLGKFLGIFKETHEIGFTGVEGLLAKLAEVRSHRAESLRKASEEDLAADAGQEEEERPMGQDGSPDASQEPPDQPDTPTNGNGTH